MTKKTVLIFAFLFYSIVVHNSDIPGIKIEMANPIRPYERLIYAVNMVEARIDSISFDTAAYNPTEEAYGAFQIRQIRLDDYYVLTGRKYLLSDMYDYDKAKEVFLYYASKYKDHEIIAKKWNGSGPDTEIYWQKVQFYVQ